MDVPLYFSLNWGRENNRIISKAASKVYFPKQFSLSASPKNDSNEEQSVTRHHHSVHAKWKRTTQAEYLLARSLDMDVFMGQTTTTIKNVLVPNEIFF